MKRLLPVAVFFAACFLSACSESAFSKKLSQSDSLVISFNAPQSDSVINTFSATQKIAINKMVKFIDAGSTTEFKCGYGGHLIFYAHGQPVLPIMFQHRDAACRHFLFEWEGKTMSTKMSQEAADFLESLEKGTN